MQTLRRFKFRGQRIVDSKAAGEVAAATAEFGLFIESHRERR